MLWEILDAGQLLLYGSVWMHFDNSELILGSSSAVSVGTIPWRPQEMLSAGRGVPEPLPRRLRPLPRGPGQRGAESWRGGHGLGRAQQDVPRP